MRRGLLQTALIVLALTLATSARAQIPAEKQSWYYEIGGAAPISTPLNPAPLSLAIGGSAGMGIGYSCGNFDITATVSTMFSNVTTSLQQTLMGAATGAIGALPLYVMQRAAPGLYELFQTYVVDFKEQFDLAFKSCEDYEREILAGNDPFESWRQAAKGASWKTQMTSGTDAVAAKQAVDAAGGDGGTLWIGGGAGGVGQPPIEPIRDVARAGWNVALNRAPATTGPWGGPPVRLVDLFPTRNSAGDFAVRTLGDSQIRTCNGCVPRTIPGHGFLPEFEAERTAVAANLAAVIGGAGVPGFAALEGISAPGVGISTAVIDSLRQLPADEQAIMGGRLASEVALARTVERALAVRRMLLAGRRVPEVAAQAQAVAEIDRAVAEVEREVDGFLYEQRIRKEISANTAGALISRGQEYKSSGAAVDRMPRTEGTHLDEGGRFQ